MTLRLASLANWILDYFPAYLGCLGSVPGLPWFTHEHPINDWVQHYWEQIIIDYPIIIMINHDKSNIIQSCPLLNVYWEQIIKSFVPRNLAMTEKVRSPVVQCRWVPVTELDMRWIYIGIDWDNLLIIYIYIYIYYI